MHNDTNQRVNDINQKVNELDYKIGNISVSPSSPANWTCTVRSGSAGGTVSCVGSEKLIVGTCSPDQYDFGFPISNGWSCTTAGSTSVPYAYCCR